MYAMVDEGRRWTCWETSVHSLAASMAVFVLMDLWRINVGAVSDLVDPSLCPPFTHPLTDRVVVPSHA